MRIGRVGYSLRSVWSSRMYEVLERSFRYPEARQACLILVAIGHDS